MELLTILSLITSCGTLISVFIFILELKKDKRERIKDNIDEAIISVKEFEQLRGKIETLDKLFNANDGYWQREFNDMKQSINRIFEILNNMKPCNQL